MNEDTHNELHLDPLTDLEVQRALALARARESYPALPRETLLEYCEAAWAVAVRADPNGRDLLGTFDRALLTIAWTRRRSGGRVPLRELVDQTIPRVALEPFIATPGEAADEEEREPALGAQPAEAPAPWRSLLRVPFSSPIPVGAAVAAGVVGLALLNEARVLPVAAPHLAGNDDAKAPDDESAPSSGKAGGSAPATPLASSGSDLLSSGLVADEFDDAGVEAQRTAVARQVDQAAAVEAGSAAAASEQATERPEAASHPAAASPIAAGEPTSPGGASAPALSPQPAPQPVVRLQMPAPAAVVEVDLPADEAEPDDPDETGGPQDDEGALVEPLGDDVREDEDRGHGRDQSEDVPEDEDRQGEDGEDDRGNSGVVELDELLEQVDAGEAGEEDGDEPTAEDDGQTPGGSETGPVGEETLPVSEEAPADPTETAPGLATPEEAPTPETSPTSPPPDPPAAPAPAAAAPAPAAPAPAPAAPAPAAPAAPAPAPAAPAPAAPAAPAPAPAAPTAPDPSVAPAAPAPESSTPEAPAAPPPPA